jgi:hypothetical protein
MPRPTARIRFVSVRVAAFWDAFRKLAIHSARTAHHAQDGGLNLNAKLSVRRVIRVHHEPSRAALVLSIRGIIASPRTSPRLASGTAVTSRSRPAMSPAISLGLPLARWGVLASPPALTAAAIIFLCGTGIFERFDDRRKRGGECHWPSPRIPIGCSRPASTDIRRYYYKSPGKREWPQPKTGVVLAALALPRLPARRLLRRRRYIDLFEL